MSIIKLLIEIPLIFIGMVCGYVCNNLKAGYAAGELMSKDWGQFVDLHKQAIKK